MDSLLPMGDDRSPSGDDAPVMSAPARDTREPSPAVMRVALELIEEDIRSGAIDADPRLLCDFFKSAINLAFDLEQQRIETGRHWLSVILRRFTADELVPNLWRAAHAVRDESDWPIWLRGIFQSYGKSHQVLTGVVQSRWVAQGTATRIEHSVEVDKRTYVHRQAFEAGSYWPRTGDRVCFSVRDVNVSVDPGVHFLLAQLRR